MTSEQRDLRDPRVDRFVHWGLSAASAVALAVGAWFFSSLNESVRGLRTEIGELREKIAVLQVGREEIAELKTELREQRERLRKLEARVGGPR
jgi:cell shape-determining protein MreC